MNKLLFLHGALGDKTQFNDVISILDRSFECHSLSFYGHGLSDLSVNGFSIESFAKQVIEYLDNENIVVIDIFGYSMGGYVALYLAYHFPNRINKIFTFATKFDWNENAVEIETQKLNSDLIELKVPAYASSLKQIHGEDKWKELLNKTASFMKELATLNLLSNKILSKISHKVLIGVGDKDKMVSLEETINIYRKLQNASLVIFPNTIHPIDKIDKERLINEIKLWF